jgi:MFS transporter, SP family, sugar:H+ symporter
VGINNSYVTQMILNGINFGVTFIGLYLVEHYGRRKSLIGGSIWMFVCFMIFASVGHFALDQEDPSRTQSASTAMICFACFFILGFATTWGPMVSFPKLTSFETVSLTIVPGVGHHRRALPLPLSSEEYGIGDRIELAVSERPHPLHRKHHPRGPVPHVAQTRPVLTIYRWNFLIAFFTPFITKAIDFRYGYVFAGCNLAAGFLVYFFVLEGQGRTLEELDTMYIEKVVPWKSSKWVPPSKEEMSRIRKEAGTELSPDAPGGVDNRGTLSGETERADDGFARKESAGDAGVGHEERV